MDFRRILFVGALAFAVTAAFASNGTKAFEDHGSYITLENNCVAGPFVIGGCEAYHTGSVCTVWGYGATGVEEFPAYYYNRPNAYCQVPLFLPY